MAKRADDLDPAVVLIEDGEPTMTFDQWLGLVAGDEPVELGIGAAELLAEARAAGEV